jgi:N-acetylglucosamine-6-sulfatase
VGALRLGTIRRALPVLLAAGAAALALSGLLAPGAVATRPEPVRVLTDAMLDPDHHSTPPPGWVNVRTPVVQPPTGPLRRATTDRTNIIVVMVDDMPETDEAILARLPTIRQLFLDHGVHFDRYHGNDPLCCPGRANFLTGLTASHHGVWTNDARLLDPRETIATELSGRGYYTFLAGKYLNMYTSSIATPPGWTHWAYTDNGYYGYTEITEGKRVHHDLDPEDYQPDVAFNRAVQFLRQAPPGQPVFAWITPFSVHGAIDPVSGDYSPYPQLAPRAVRDPRCDDLPRWHTPAHEDDNSDRPFYERAWHTMRQGYDQQRACRALIPVDEGLARVVDELRAQGRLDHTMIVFTADNGMGWGAHGYVAKDVTFATQIPLFVWWPDGRGTTRQTDATMLSNVDLAPTLCAVAGCTMGPYADGRQKPDGTSFLGVITGRSRLVRTALFTQDRASGMSWWAIRTTPDSGLGTWHYAEYETGERELYDVSNGPCWAWNREDGGDPCELRNRADDPDLAPLVARLHDLLALAVATGGDDPAFRGRVVPAGSPTGPAASPAASAAP